MKVSSLAPSPRKGEFPIKNLSISHAAIVRYGLTALPRGLPWDGAESVRVFCLIEEIAR